MTLLFRRAALAAFGLLVLSSSAWADVKLPKIFSDNMVLQQQTQAPIWGWAEPGEKVVVVLGDAKADTVADDKGKWMVKLATPAAGGEPRSLVVEGKNRVEFKNVLLGEVWVCSGQSNMDWSVAASANPQEEIANAKHPNIRLFLVPRTAAVVKPEPQTDFEQDLKWTECSPETVPHFSAVAYYFARKLQKETGVPVGLINVSWGGTICETWLSKPALEADPEWFGPILERHKEFKPGQQNQTAALYNGMVSPLLPYAIRGALWYQGESNVGRAEQYAKLFPAMIADWRKQWGQGDFPFLFVQLAPYCYAGDNKTKVTNDSKRLPELWDAQVKTLAVPNTGMAVTTDITELFDIHPKNKQDVGLRLALWALANTYGKSDLVYSGPLYDSMAVEGNKIRIKFKHVGGGLEAKDGQPLNFFTIAGEDGNFVDAQAVIDGDTVVVTSDSVAKPTAVRFGWKDYATPNLFNKAGLPASPFRTDSFKLVTAGAK